MSLLKHLIASPFSSIPSPSFEVLFVVDDAAAPDARDTPIYDLLVANSYNVTYISDDSLTAGDATGYDLVLISSDVSGGGSDTTFLSTAVPVLAMSQQTSDGHNMTSGAGNTANGTTISIDDPFHPITFGMSIGTTTVLTSGTGMLQASSYGSGTALASETGVSANKVIIAWDTGTAMATGTAPAKRAILFIRGQAGLRLTSDGETLLLNCCGWLIL